MPLAHVSFCTNGRAEQHLSIRAIEHVEEAVAIRLQQQLARLALEHRVDEHRRLLRVPVPQIVRRELIVPAQLSGFRVEREDRIRVEVVALAARCRRCPGYGFPVGQNSVSVSAS